MGEQPKISVVIPVYNREALIERAVASAQRQTFQPYEIIVADDGSTDNTAQVVQALEVTYVRQENAGGGEARNLGVRHATGDWIAFLDSDDYWFDDHLACLRDAVIATDGRARLYFSDIIRTEAEGLLNHWQRCNMSIDEPFVLAEKGHGDWVFLPRQPTMLQASLIDRHAFQRLNGLWGRLKIRHDSHIFFRLALDGPVCAVNHVGTQMTSDDEPENRLFGGGYNRPGSRIFQAESVLMYRHLVAESKGAPQHHRREFRRRLKAAHFSMARLERQDGNWLAAVKNAALGTVASPRHTAISLLARTGLVSRDAR